jgi:hypothetical protein
MSEAEIVILFCEAAFQPSGEQVLHLQRCLATLPPGLVQDSEQLRGYWIDQSLMSEALFEILFREAAFQPSGGQVLHLQRCLATLPHGLVLDSEQLRGYWIDQSLMSEAEIVIFLCEAVFQPSGEQSLHLQRCPATSHPALALDVVQIGYDWISPLQLPDGKIVAFLDRGLPLPTAERVQHLRWYRVAELNVELCGDCAVPDGLIHSHLPLVFCPEFERLLPWYRFQVT